MNVLSLFDGMSCGQIALKELSIPVEKYYASEIDKYAIQQSTLNFPNTIHLGSVVNVDVSQLDHIDLLIGGSPCQSFSFAGKRKGMATKTEIEITKLSQYLELKEQGFEFEGQSYLFWEYMRILTDIRKYNPNVKFLLENVEMGAKWERVLSEAIGIFGVHINSNLVSAQNRARIYWTNILVEEVGLFGELHSGIPQPKDRGILLKDILETEVDEKYYLSDKIINGSLKGKGDWADRFSPHDINSEKCNTITSRYHKSGKSDPYIKLDKKLNPKPDQNKASCFTAGGNSGGNHSDMDLICVAMRGRNPDNTSDRSKGSPTEQRLEPNMSGKTNCLTSVQKDNLIAIGCDFRTDEGFRFRDNGKSGTLAARARNDESCGQLASINSRIRRLTPTECARLQTIPDWYKWECSDTQIYKMCGNGWTVQVIKHILSFLNSF